MKVRLLDLATGRSAWMDGITEWQITEGNHSCDCNRGMYFGIENDSEGCVGCKRFIVTDLEFTSCPDLNTTKEEIIAAANSDYFHALNHK